MKKRFIVYDLPEEDLPADNGDIMFSASPIVKPCMGCFGCWVKTPGKCVINDRCAAVPGNIAQCGEVIYISPVVYGGYSEKIKAVIDRTIPYVLPYFRIVKGEMHHKMRYKNPFKMTVYFYGECDAEEREIAESLVNANAINFGAGSVEVKFYDTAKEAKEAVLCVR